MQDALERFAETGGVGAGIRDVIVFTGEDQRLLPRQDLAHDGDILTRLEQRFAVGNAVPALNHLWPGQTQPQN